MYIQECYRCFFYKKTGWKMFITLTPASFQKSRIFMNLRMVVGSNPGLCLQVLLDEHDYDLRGRRGQHHQVQLQTQARLNRVPRPLLGRSGKPYWPNFFENKYLGHTQTQTHTQRHTHTHTNTHLCVQRHQVQFQPRRDSTEYLVLFFAKQETKFGLFFYK